MMCVVSRIILLKCNQQFLISVNFAAKPTTDKIFSGFTLLACAVAGGQGTTLHASSWPSSVTRFVLQELKTTFVLGDLQQLHGTPLIGCKSSYFMNEVSDQYVVGSGLALSGPWLGLEGVKCGLVTFVETGIFLAPPNHGPILKRNHNPTIPFQS
jgi:hypothetical protein